MRSFIFLTLAVVATNAALAPVYYKDYDGVPGSYIVVLNDNVNVKSFVGRFKRDVTSSANVKTFFNVALNGFAVDADKAALELLRTLPGVSYIEEDGIYEIAGGMNKTNCWGQDRVDQRPTEGDGKMILSGYGKETRLYFLDTGINIDDPEFGKRNGRDRAEVKYDAYPEDGSKGTDWHGHGTSVARVAAGLNYGVANEAWISGIRVLDSSGKGFLSKILEGFNYALNSGSRPMIIILAMQGPNSESFKQVIERAYTMSAMVVVAAGNKNINCSNVSPANVPYPYALTVASSDVNDNRASDSNWGECVDVFAPGVDIVTSSTGSTSSGTSMACAHATGIASAIMQNNQANQYVIKQVVDSATPDAIYDGPDRPKGKLVYDTPNVGGFFRGTPQPNPPPPPSRH